MFPTLRILDVNVLNTKGNLEKFDSKSFEALFVGYSNTSKAYTVFNRSTLIIEKYMHVKLRNLTL